MVLDYPCFMQVRHSKELGERSRSAASCIVLAGRGKIDDMQGPASSCVYKHIEQDDIESIELHIHT